MGLQKCSLALTTSSISCTPSEHSSTGTLVRAWKKVNSQKPVRIWLHWRKTMRKLALRRLRVKGRRKDMVMNSEADELNCFQRIQCKHTGTFTLRIRDA